MLIDGRAIANQIQNEIKDLLIKLPGKKPCLTVIMVGDNPASQTYVSRKTKACSEVGISSKVIELPSDVTEMQLVGELTKLNQNDSVDGILIQLPLPAHLNPIKIIAHLNPEKDVDGLHPINVGKLLTGDPSTFIPCTPLGIKVMLEHLFVEVDGKHVVIIGRSNIVGKPLAALLMQNIEGGNATVTVAHSHTKNIKELCATADILIAAMGYPKFITADMVKQGAVVIDVGINRIPSATHQRGYQIVGDVDFENVHQKCSFITPVPGGVGPMTIAMLLSNTMKGFLKRIASKPPSSLVLDSNHH